MKSEIKHFKKIIEVLKPDLKKKKKRIGDRELTTYTLSGIFIIKE